MAEQRFGKGRAAKAKAAVQKPQLKDTIRRVPVAEPKRRSREACEVAAVSAA
jgi:hypothetical protein